MIFATESTFASQVLRAPLPVVVLFGLRSCAGRRAMQSLLADYVAAHPDRLLLRVALLDDAPLLAEQYAIAASPTVIVFQHGEPQSRAIGFLPAGLLQLLINEVLADGLSGADFWSPLEEALEDLVIIPLLHSWGFVVRRQVSCSIGNMQRRGRIDLLVYEGEQPLTLIESKRHLRSEWELQQAVRQAAAYARALDLTSFVVAAPAGLWFYRRDNEANHLVRYVTSLELAQKPRSLRQLLRSLATTR